MKRSLLLIVAVIIFTPCYATEPNFCTERKLWREKHVKYELNKLYIDESTVDKTTKENLIFVVKLCDKKNCPNGFAKYSLDDTTFYGCDTLDEFLKKYLVPKTGYIDYTYVNPKEYSLYAANHFMELRDHYYLCGPWERYKDKTILNFGEGDDGFSKILNEKFGAKAYALDIAYEEPGDKEDAKKKAIAEGKVYQDVSVSTEEFLKIKDIILGIQNGVDYVISVRLLCCIIANYDPYSQPAWDIYPKYFNAKALKQTLLNTIAILKDGGRANFFWSLKQTTERTEIKGLFEKKEKDINEKRKDMKAKELSVYYEWYDVAVAKVIDEIKKDNPKVKIQYYSKVEDYAAGEVPWALLDDSPGMLLKLCKINPTTQDCSLD